MILRLFLVVLLLTPCLVDCRRRYRGGAGRRGGSGVGQGIAKMMQNIGQPEEERETVSGSDTKTILNTHKIHKSMVEGDTLLIVGVVILTIVGIFLFIVCSSNNNSNEHISVIREMRAQDAANYAITKAIAEHGVHPAKASGDLYRIKL